MEIQPTFTPSSTSSSLFQTYHNHKIDPPKTNKIAPNLNLQGAVNQQSPQFAQTINQISVKVETLQQFKYQQNMETIFDIGEVVWAKITGYPWWPGAIDQIYHSNLTSDKTYLIKFFGEDSCSTLPFSKIAKYCENRSTFLKKAVNSKRLKDSIEVAENIIQGKSSLQQQLRKIKQRVMQTFKMSKKDLYFQTSVENSEINQSKMVEQSQIFSEDEIIKNAHNDNSFSQRIVLSLEQEDFLEKLEIRGIDQQNVVEILQCGFLRRLMFIQRDKAERLQRIAKKALIRKYFSKRIDEKCQKQKSSKKRGDQLSKPAPRRKIINKVASKVTKPVRKQVGCNEIQILCGKKIFNILKMFDLDSQSCRTISSHLIRKLKSNYSLNSNEFKNQFLLCIDWLRHHKNSPQFIKGYYERAFEGENQDNSKQSEETAEMVSASPLY